METAIVVQLSSMVISVVPPVHLTVMRSAICPVEIVIIVNLVSMVINVIVPVQVIVTVDAIDPADTVIIVKVVTMVITVNTHAARTVMNHVINLMENATSANKGGMVTCVICNALIARMRSATEIMGSVLMVVRMGIMISSALLPVLVHVT